MEDSESIVEHYLGEFRAGKPDNAFHGLIELDSSIVPELIKAFEETDKIHLKVFIIEVISEFRCDSSLCFLGSIIHNEASKIWKAALNGMTMVESREAVDVMVYSLVFVHDSTKRAWIEEAINDTNDLLNEKKKMHADQNSK